MPSPGATVRNPLRAWVLGLRRWRLRHRQRRAIAASAVFDPAWYRATYPEVGAADPVRHYLASRDGRRPSPWFDAAWYVARYPDVTAFGVDPLAHYLLYGAAEGRNPNAAFATGWYLDNYPAAAADRTPLDHYVRQGAAAGHDPAPEFDAAWYAERHMGEDAVGLDPLAHFLLVGQPAGIRLRTTLGRQAADWADTTPLESFKPLACARDAVIAVIWATATQGGLCDNARRMTETLAQAGLSVVLLVETDTPFAADPQLVDQLAGGYVRGRRGFAPAAFAQLMRSEPLLFSGEMLWLVSDELAAPATQAEVAGLLARLRQGAAEVVSAGASGGRGRRPDSRFLVLRRRALARAELHGVLTAVTTRPGDPQALREDFERQLASGLAGSGLKLELLTPAAGFPFAAAPPGAAEGAPAAGAPSGPLLAPGLAAPAPATEPWKIAYIGPWNYASGLSLASRGYLSALWRTGARLNLHPVERAFHVHTRLAPTVSARDFEGQADAVIVHLNPDAWHMLTEAQRAVIDQARVRIGLWVWEMGHVPPTWQANFEAVDEIWTPSRYCAEVFAAQTRAPVSVVPHVVPIPPPSEGFDRAGLLRELGLEPQARLVLYAFDGASYIERKNPQALVRAFVAAGLAARGWRLVLKTKNLMDQPREGAALARLAAGAAGVSLLEKQLGQDAHAALFELADIYASPHRSEGFGLTVAEAMALGKPVVATDFGGVRDFLDASCGYPVPAATVRLDRDLGAYRSGGVWGEVDEMALTEALRQAAAAVEAGDGRIGARAQARIAERLSAEAVAEAMTKALARALAAPQPRVSAA